LADNYCAVFPPINILYDILESGFFDGVFNLIEGLVEIFLCILLNADVYRISVSILEGMTVKIGIVVGSVT